MLAKFLTNASGILFSWRDNSSLDAIPWVRCVSGNVLWCCLYDSRKCCLGNSVWYVDGTVFLQVLVTMFTNVLSNTPSEPKGLTALAIWILGSLILVFIALLLYVFILVNMRRLAKKTSTGSSPEEKSRVDFDSIFLLTHLSLFAIFIFVYAISVFAWKWFEQYVSSLSVSL